MINFIDLENGWILKKVKQNNIKMLAKDLCPDHDNFLFISIEQQCTRSESFTFLNKENTMLFRNYQYVYSKTDDILYESISNSRTFLDKANNRKIVSKLIREYCCICTMGNGIHLTGHFGQKSDLFVSLNTDRYDISLALNSNTSQGIETWIRTIKNLERREFEALSKKEKWLLIEELIRYHRLNLIKK